MPTCNKCQSSFPNHIIINNKEHNLQSRKYCLECSPFKKHNTLRLHISQKKKLHSRDYADFNLKEKREFNAICAKNQTKSRKNKKIFYAEFKGGKCEKCGYDKNYSALSFHHRNPKEKCFEINARSFVSHSKEEIEKEVNKCDLLCMNCHLELHNPTWNKDMCRVGVEPTTKKL